MGEKSPDPLNVVRAKLVSPCEEERRNSWASGCPPHLLAFPVDILFLLNKSQRAQVLLWKSKILQDAAFPVPRHSFKYIPMKWHIAGLCSVPWGAWNGEGQCKNHRTSSPALGKAQLVVSGSHSSPATWVPTMFLKSGVKADNYFPETTTTKWNKSSITSDFQSCNYLASPAGEEQHVCPSYIKYPLQI